MIGNHTASHRSLAAPEVSLDGFIADVETADDALRGLSTFVPMLRFPYLKEGDTLAKRDGMRAWMKRRGYRPAPVSIDASDWYYNRIYAGHLATGESIIWAQARAAGIPGLRYPAEDAVYEAPRLREAGLIP